MAMINFDYVGLLHTIQGLEQIKDKSETIINNVLHSFGAEEIKKDIIPLIHNSGREWNGKPKHASQTQPFRDKKENLGLIVRNKPNYSYLYFVDNGENTKRHQGNQQFMRRGAENATNSIKQRIISQIINELN